MLWAWNTRLVGLMLEVVKPSPAGVCRPSVKLEWVCPPGNRNIPQLGGVALLGRGPERGPGLLRGL